MTKKDSHNWKNITTGHNISINNRTLRPVSSLKQNPWLGLENKSGQIFCVQQVYFTKSCQQIWGCVLQTNLLYFLYVTSEVKQYYLSYRPQTIFQDKLHSVSIQDDQSWAFSKTVQRISKITYTASRFSLLTSTKFAVLAVVECLKEHW